MLARSATLLCCALLASCDAASPPHDHVSQGGSGPTSSTVEADAGADVRVELGQYAELQGDVRGDRPGWGSVELIWSLASRPEGSQVELGNASGSRLRFQPDVAGEYHVALVVRTAQGDSEPDEAIVTAFVDQPPVAVIDGPDTVELGTNAEYDGSKSSDPEGGPLYYEWRSHLEGEADPGYSFSSLPTYTLRLAGAGRYTLDLTVTDRKAHRATATRTVVCTLPPGFPTADAGPDQEVLTRTLVTLDGSGSSDPDGDPLSLTWQVVAVPAGGGYPSLWGDRPSFVPLVAGSYEFELRVEQTTGGIHYPATDRVVIHAHDRGSTAADIRRLDAPVVGAAYSRPLERLVLLESDPPRLVLLDPFDGTTTGVDLPAGGTTLSLGPDGLHAAIGFPAKVAAVDLVGLKVTATRDVDDPVGDVILADGWVYVLPPLQSYKPLRSVEMATGKQLTSDPGDFSQKPPPGGFGVLHPAGDAIYVLGSGSSGPIQRWSVTDGQPAFAWDGGYRSGNDTCGDLLLPAGSRRLVTQCGSTFATSGSQSEDLRYTGNLAGESGRNVGLTAVDVRDGELVWLPGSRYPWITDAVPAVLQVSDADTLVPLRTIPLPDFVVGGKAYAATGRYVFLAQRRAIVILRADAQSGLLAPDGVALIDLEAP